MERKALLGRRLLIIIGLVIVISEFALLGYSLFGLVSLCGLPAR